MTIQAQSQPVRWARRYAGMKRTGTGTGTTNPPWHVLIDPPAASFPRTACGKRLRGIAERTVSPEGKICPDCVAATTSIETSPR